MSSDPKNTKVASIIVAGLKKPVDKSVSGPYSDPTLDAQSGDSKSEGKMAAAEEMMDAIKKGDHKALHEAMSSFCDMHSSEDDADKEVD